MTKYVIAASKDWFFQTSKSKQYQDCNFIEVRQREGLTLSYLKEIQPRYIFFPHWNWIVPPEIHDNFECVVFHTAPLPHGRGGSPIQNLIIQGFSSAPVCALRMGKTLDGGPIYCSKTVSLAGNLSDIFSRLGMAIEELIIQIIKDNPEPVPQLGDSVNFRRLSVKDNELNPQLELTQLYDRIRMVDHGDYPRAYIKFGKFLVEFHNAKFEDNQISGSVRIRYDHD